MTNWFKKLFAFPEKIKSLKTEEKMPNEMGLNEEMVSTDIDLEPKESDGLAKIFEETGKEEPEGPESAEADAEEKEDNKQ